MKAKRLLCSTHLPFPIGLLLAAGCLLFGCSVAGPVAVSMGVGTVYLNKERAQIRVTENESDAKDCQLVKHVKASSAWGGLAFQDKALEKTISDLTHESVEAGANLLLIRSKQKSFGGSKSEGDAYRCPIAENSVASSTEPPAEKTKNKEDKGL